MAETARFVFETYGDPGSAFEPVDPTRIGYVRHILSEEEAAKVHAVGGIAEEPAGCNPKHGFHTASDTVRFFDAAVAGGNTLCGHVDDRQAEAEGASPPGVQRLLSASDPVREAEPV